MARVLGDEIDLTKRSAHDAGDSNTDRRLRVLHVVPSFYPAHVYGGTIQSGLQLCRALARAGCAVRVLTTDANGKAAVLDVEKHRDVELDDGVLVRYAPRLAGHSISLSFLRLLPEYLRWADVVHLTAVYNFPTIPTLLACRIADKPLVWSPRGALQRWSGSRRVGAKSIWDRVCDAVAPRAAVLHVTSEEEAVESAEKIRDRRSVVVPNGVPIPDKTAEPSASPPVRLLFIGRIDPKKGIENLLDACRLLDERAACDWTLTIAGSGEAEYLRSIEAHIDTLGLRTRVTMAGEVLGDNKAAVFLNADIAVVPSHTENFGIVVAEALAHGVPVIASRGTPWSEIPKHGCGLWVDNDPQSLCDAVCQLIESDLLLSGERGRRWMVEEFTWDARGQQMLDVFQQIRAR